jgi:hypothetical protein
LGGWVQVCVVVSRCFWRSFVMFWNCIILNGRIRLARLILNSFVWGLSLIRNIGLVGGRVIWVCLVWINWWVLDRWVVNLFRKWVVSLSIIVRPNFLRLIWFRCVCIRQVLIRNSLVLRTSSVICPSVILICNTLAWIVSCLVLIDSWINLCIVLNFSRWILRLRAWIW